ncbi:imidazole glycerol phosphate synthase subunit HisH [Adhaeribacter sp. BT258]|uniref:Imidazole glycerol phosphate synthase subunit HisH n=1 Tax=Adhaeribacter terrigena TaxID=2793070 RepID=A0ABS1BXC0_9BACT|nr:imidazole glycerol phosphate synthase subunit HisH [Adhaeribacter terrigena]MBK0401715.1 imidazole glycerol phosphate synthase subunit HisH [Adhaeribacter terrigena]
MITIIDYGLGNLGSVANMMKKVNVDAIITSNLAEIERAEKILLPGVGAFDAAMEKLTDTELREILDHKVLEERIPVLGICLGMQLLTKGSDEGTLPGLGWVPAYTHKFPDNLGIKIPHMGWNYVIHNRDNPLTGNFDKDFRFYFVHSYFVKVENEENSILKATHGITFDAAVQNSNVFGAQFHPEKSHRFGMQLFKNFSLL